MPGKVRINVFLCPRGGSLLEVADEVGNACGRLQAYEEVDVVLHAADGARNAAYSFGHPADVCVQAVAFFLCDHRGPIFGGEDDMVVEAGEG